MCMVCPLFGDIYACKMYQLEKTNAYTIMQSFNDLCMKLWPGGGSTIRKVRLVLTDQARYMLSAFQQLKSVYFNLNHVTCIAHELRRVCDSIRENYSRENVFIAALKKIDVKASNRQVLCQEVTGLHLPQFCHNKSLEKEGMEEEQWKKLMSVRNNLDGFAKVIFELNLKNNRDVESFATLTEFPLRVLTR
ncbi:hypothetical protein ANN_13747 [Periplaneta americana]|uniref:DUF659 domain-containing protein n=1 Tax=Periplaneta americana TaxID=6978 RepID=A0ABQ8SVD8_PERAM|nr:hypothetical protein ANN_13747 [Periplaneta americana]